MVYQSAQAPRAESFQSGVQQCDSHHGCIRFYHASQPRALHFHAGSARSFDQLHLHVHLARNRPPSVLGAIPIEGGGQRDLGTLRHGRSELFGDGEAFVAFSLLPIRKSHGRRALYTRLLAPIESGHARFCRCGLRLWQQHAGTLWRTILCGGRQFGAWLRGSYHRPRRLPHPTHKIFVH